MNPFRTPPDPPAAEVPPAGVTDNWLHWMILAVGLLPYLGLAVHGRWSQSELGIATIMVLFAGRQIGREYMHRRAWLSRRERTQGTRADE